MRLPDIIFHDADFALVQSDGQWSRMLKKNTGNWEYKDIELESEPQNGINTLFVTAQKTGVQRIVLRWAQDLDQPVKLIGDHWERSYGDLEWRGIVSERIMPWYFLAYDGPTVWGYGVKTQPGALCFWMVDKEYVTLCMDIRCGGSNVMLSGRRLCAAALVSICDTCSPFEAAHDLCLKMCDKPKKPLPPVYGGNDWYYSYGKSSAFDILADARRISELAESNVVRPFMVIDGGWQIGDSAVGGGPWDRGNSRFPDIQRLADNIKEAGCQPGIWYRPLLTAKPGEKRILCKKSSQPILDPSDELVLEQVSQDVRRFADWGYELIKHDFSTYDITGRWGFEMAGEFTDENWTFSDTHKTTAEIITQFYRTIQDAAGTSLTIGCNTIGHLCAGIFDINRIGDDTSGLQWERTRRMGINALAFRLPQHDVFFSADADCVGITTKIDWRLNEQWLKLLSESGTPVFVSLSPDAYGKEQRAALKKAFAEAVKPKGVCQPVDWMETTCPSKWILNGSETEFNWSNQCNGPSLNKI